MSRRTSIVFVMKKSGAERLKESIERKKQQNRERARRFREKKREELRETNRTGESFKHRGAKKRAVDKVKEVLPVTPEKKVAVVSALLDSPTTRQTLALQGVVSSAEEQKRANINSVIVADARSLIQKIKDGRSKDSRAAMQCCASLLCGENVTENKMQKVVAETLSINRERIRSGIRHRKRVLIDKTEGWTAVKRKRRNDATPEEHLKIACDFWASPGISRPTGNKKDIVRERIAANEYIEHERQVLEMTQNEVFSEFKAKYPDLKMGQRTFENCKPFYVAPARPEDRNSCCCRAHVETRMLFTACMKFRKQLVKESPEKEHEYPVYTHLTDVVDKTLCPKLQEDDFHQKKCCDRECPNCGIKVLKFLPEEESTVETGPKVKWQRFEYVIIEEKRRLQLVEKETPPGEMFAYFKSLFAKFSGHRLRANWQSKQLKSIVQCLPIGHVVCVHDYSENYSCQHQDQIQSLYYGQTQASIHVTVMHRHSLAEIDGEDSTPDNPKIVTEHLFVISPDLKHDHHSVHHCRTLVAKYLTQIRCPVIMMHEWTDGCSAQYKSRHCMGDVSYSVADFGYPTIRNYFETSHAKGPQDGAGANLKFKADMAVIRRQAVIQNAADLYQFAQEKLKVPSGKASLSQRVFFYVGEHERERPRRYFKEIRGNRAIHSILANGQSEHLKLRELSCYCDNCIGGHFDDCENALYVESWEEQILEQEASQRRATRNDVVEMREGLLDLVSKNSTVAIASGDVGEDYYLLNVISDHAEILRSNVTDDWNAQYRAGSKVIRGHFYERVDCQQSSSNRFFRLVTDKTGYVYSSTVRFICSELEELAQNSEKLFKLSEAEHLDILGSLDGF